MYLYGMQGFGLVKSMCCKVKKQGRPLPPLKREVAKIDNFCRRDSAERMVVPCRETRVEAAAAVFDTNPPDIDM